MFPGNSAVVVKGCSFIVQDYFAYLLSRKLNVPSPNTRVVQYSDKEFKKIIHYMRSVSYTERYITNRINCELDRPFFLVMDYIPSLHFLTLGQSRAKTCLGRDSRIGHQRLRTIGEIVAFDVWINNSDRVPVIWSNDGNPNNFVIEMNPAGLTTEQALDPDFYVDMGGIFAIDFSTVCIEHIGRRREYLRRVNYCVRAVMGDLRQILNGGAIGLSAMESMLKVKDFFVLHCGVKLEKAQLFQVLKGTAMGFYRISSVENSDLHDIFESIRQFPIEDRMNIWANGVGSLEIDFYLEIQSGIKEVLEEFGDALRVLRDIYQYDDPLLFSI